MSENETNGWTTNIKFVQFSKTWVSTVVLNKLIIVHFLVWRHRLDLHHQVFPINLLTIYSQRMT